MEGVLSAGCPIPERGGGGTPYNGLYRETFPKRGNFYKLQVYKRVGESVFLVCKLRRGFARHVFVKFCVLFSWQLSGNRFCDEKNDWLDSHKENATVEEINKQKRELEELLKPILSKLDDSGNFFLIKVIFSKLFYDLKPRKLFESIKRRKVEFLEKKYVWIAKKEDTFFFFFFHCLFFSIYSCATYDFTHTIFRPSWVTMYLNLGNNDAVQSDLSTNQWSGFSSSY